MNDDALANTNSFKYSPISGYLNITLDVGNINL